MNVSIAFLRFKKLRITLITVHNLFKDDIKQNTVRPVVEEDLPADFKKKLEEWRTKVTFTSNTFKFDCFF